MDRTTTTEGTLARLGFGDPHRAAETLDAWFAEHGDGCGALVDQVIASAPLATRVVVVGVCMDDDTIPLVIKQMWQDHQYVIDPHTACAFTDMAPDRVSVVLSTASPAKFPEVVQAATGSEPTHSSLEALKAKPLQTHPQDATDSAVKAFLRAHL